MPSFKLNPPSMNRLLEYFRRFTDPETCQQVIDELTHHKQNAEIPCPHCQSLHVVRYGKYRDRQRYKCRNCSRTFNDFTHTPLHGTHYPHKWIKFLECMLAGYSLRRSAVHVKVSYVTLFYWRHKLIQVLQLLQQEQVESVPQPEQVQATLRPEQVEITRQPEQVHPLLQKVLDFWDKTSSYWGKVTPEKKANPRFIYVKRRKHFPDITPMEQEAFREWIYPFYRIASKYWSCYVAWFRFMEKVRHLVNLDTIKEMLFSSCSIRYDQTYQSLCHPS